MAKFVKRGTNSRRKGVTNDWRCEWLDRRVNDFRIGDVSRKLDKKGSAFCVWYEKGIFLLKFLLNSILTISH